MNKEESTIRNLQALIDSANRPAILSSFGKDSMALLHMVRQLGLKLDVITHRTPYFLHKWLWGFRQSVEWQLNVYDWAPRSVQMQENRGRLAVIENFDIGSGAVMGFQRMVQKAEDVDDDRDYVCLRKEILQRPKGMMEFPWDLLISGQKSSDSNPIYGEMPLKVDRLVSQPGVANIAFPLRLWTDEDVWDYIHFHHVPYDHTRYSSNDPWWSNDYIHACAKCVDRREKEVVYCPLQKCSINNVSRHVQYIDACPEYIDA